MCVYPTQVRDRSLSSGLEVTLFDIKVTLSLCVSHCKFGIEGDFITHIDSLSL